MKYLKRLIEKDLDDDLDIMGAVLIVGPKWCGKTTTAKQYVNSVLELQDPTTRESYLRLAEIKPLQLLEGEKPRLIDEWQLAPVLWDAIRISVDNSDSKRLYILTTSTVVDENKIMHSGIGRIHRLLLYPMSLYESKDSNGKISLKSLFEENDLDIDGVESDLTIEELLYVACRG